MASGAPDHHLPSEAIMHELVDAVNNLKITLTNLNIMPPVAETPWAVKNIGRAGFLSKPLAGLTTSTKETILELEGSGQILSMVVHAYCTDEYGKWNSYLYITVDDVLVFSGYAQYLFSQYASVGMPQFGLSGVAANADDRWVMFYNVPIYYSSKIKLEWKNMSTTDMSFTSYFVSYTNLPAP